MKIRETAPDVEQERPSAEKLDDREVAERFAAIQEQLTDMPSDDVEEIAQTAANKSIQGSDFAGFTKSHQPNSSVFESQ